MIGCDILYTSMSSLSDQKIQIGQKISSAREKKRLSQAEVADLVKIHTNYYARIERGDANPTLDVLLAIADVLEMNLLNTR